MKRQLLPVVTFARIDIKRLFRDKMAMFFTFVFPLLFLFVFGGIFGRDADVNFNIALLSNSDSQFAKQFIEEGKKEKIFKINEEVKDLDSAKELMSRGELDAAIILPESFGRQSEKGYPAGQAEVVYNKNNEQSAQMLGSILQSIFDGVNAKLAPSDKPFTVKMQSTERAGLRQFDYIFSGLLGFTILSLGIFGPTNVFPKLKEKGVLRRYRTTTLKVWQYFVGNVLSNVFVGLLSVLVMFIVGIVFFNLNMQGGYLDLLLLILLGATTMFGIGLAIGGWAKNERQAAPLAQIVTFPMMFLSGSFFPRFLFPEWLQKITDYMPLTPIIDAARLIITEGRGLLELLPQFGLIAAWCLVIYILAFRLFRWE